MLHKLKRALRRLFRWRSSQTGRFVTKNYADHHPDVTVAERVIPDEAKMIERFKRESER